MSRYKAILVGTVMLLLALLLAQRRSAITPEGAARFYDGIGGTIDDWLSALIEGPIVQDMIAHGKFSDANSLFEFGCGTGRLARKLLQDELNGDCKYSAVEVSGARVAQAEDRLGPWLARVSIIHTNGTLNFTNIHEDSKLDRFVSTFVLDLLSNESIAILLREAHRILRPDGFLCLTGLSKGITVASKLVEVLWMTAYRIHPSLVGGCRPVSLLDNLPREQWALQYHSVISLYGVPVEALIASPLK